MCLRVGLNGVLPGALLLAFLGGCAGRPPAAAARPADTEQVSPKYAYAAGLEFGRRVRARLTEDGLQADHDLILKGVRDGLEAKQPAYPDAELAEVVERIMRSVRQHQAERQLATDPIFRKIAEENAKRSREALVRAERMEGVEKMDGGVLVKSLKDGDGRYVANAKSITVNFELSLSDGTKVHASDPGKPATVPMAQLPAGLAQVLPEMRVGSHWRIALPPEKAFGLPGRPPVIGPNEAVLFDVELVGAE